MSQLRLRFRVAAAVTVVFVVWIAVGVLTWPRVDPTPVSPPRVVIALTSSAKSDSTLDDGGTKRLTKAIDVARQSGARLFTTRGFWRGHFTDGGQLRMIRTAGLLSRWTMLSGLPRSTHDEALLLRAALPDSGPIVVVTSPLHTRRACATFEHLGFRVICIASRQYPWWTVPYGFVYEQLAMIKYRWNGWIR